MKEEAIQNLKDWENVTNQDICNIIEQIICVYNYMGNNEYEKFLVKELSEWKNGLDGIG